jgi:hypothetical protein
MDRISSSCIRFRSIAFLRVSPRSPWFNFLEFRARAGDGVLDACLDAGDTAAVADQNDKRKWWLAARNMPLVAGALNLGLATCIYLTMRPGSRNWWDEIGIVDQLGFGAAMGVLARYLPWRGARAAAVILGGLSSGLLGFVSLFEGKVWPAVIGVVIVALWALAFHSVLFFGRGWTKEAVARAGCCVNCGYDRSGLEPGAVCPECGQA